MRIKGIVGAVAVVLASGAITLLVCEAATRIIYPPMRGIHWYQTDPRYGMRHLSSLDESVTEWGDGAYWHFRTNAHGFRGGEWADMPAAGTRRVLVMGDSFTFGDGVNEGEAFPEVASHASGAGNGAPWEVLNLGVSAWGPQNALAYLETEGAPIQASCLVYTFFLGNDVMDNAASHLYSRHDGGLEKDPVVSAPPRSADRVKRVMHALPIYDLLLDHSQIFNLVRAVFIDKTTDYRALADTYAEVPRETYARALDLNDATLTRMARLAQDRFGGFALILLPELAQLDGAPDLHPSLELVPVDLAEEGRARVKQWAQANAVPVLDLVDLLPHDAAAARQLYFQRDFHMNAAGHQRLGELLAQQLPRLCEARHASRQSAQR